MTLQTVKLSQLRLSPLNVRRVKPKAIDQLAADMLAQLLPAALLLLHTHRMNQVLLLDYRIQPFTGQTGYYGLC